MAFSFSSTSGSSGVTSITVSATSRQELTDLVEDFTLSNQTKSMAMPIAQRAYQPSEKYIIFSPVTMSIGSSGGTASLNVQSNDNWVIVADDWIQLSRFMDIDRGPQTISGDGNTIIGIRLFENIGEARTGTISGYCVSDSSITASTVVSQAGSYVKPYIILGSYSADVQYNASSYTFSVSSNTSWNVTTEARWVTLNTLSGTGNSNVSYSVLANSGEHRRTATITVFNADEGIMANFTLVQEAEQEYPYIKVEPNSFNVSWSGTSGNVISVSANCDYDITTDVAWITTNAASGSGNGSVSFTTLPNSGSSDVGNIVLANSAVSKVVTVQRQAVGKYLSASTNYISSSSTGGTFEVSVYSNVNWAVSVDTGEETPSTHWLSAMPVSGSNDGILRISVANTMSGRTGSVVLTNSNYGLSWVISVEQQTPSYTDRIYYTSTGNTVVTPSTTENWGANIVSNTYSDGIGIIGFDDEVTFIPNGAFNGKAELNSIIIPNSVSGIGSYALYGTSVESFVIPDSVLSAWQYSVASTALTELTIGKNCTMVRNGTYDWAFLPETIEKLYVRTENIPTNFIGGGGYGSIRPLNGCAVILEDTVKNVGISSFSLCGIDTLEIVNTDNLESIQGGAFETNTLNPLVIRLPHSYVQNPNLGNTAFYECDGITELDLKANVIGSLTFSRCTNLRKITLRPTSTSSVATVNIGSRAFEGCSSLSEIYSYCNYDFQFSDNYAFNGVSETGTLHYKAECDYPTSTMNKLPSGWTAVADL